MIKRLCLVSILFIIGCGGEGEKQPPVIVEQKDNVDGLEDKENYGLFKAHEAAIVGYWDKEGRGKWEAETKLSDGGDGQLAHHHLRSLYGRGGGVFWHVMLDIWLRYGNGRVVVGGGYPVPQPRYPAPYPNPNPQPWPPPHHYPTCDEYKGAYCWCEDVYSRRRWDGGWCSASVVFGRVGQNGTVCYAKHNDGGRGERGLPYCDSRGGHSRRRR